MSVTSNSAGSGSSAGFAVAGSGLGMGLSFQVVRGRGSPSGGGAQGVDGVGGDAVERVGGVGDDVDAVALDAERFDADREVDGGDAVLGQPAHLLDAGLVSAQPPSEST